MTLVNVDGICGSDDVNVGRAGIERNAEPESVPLPPT